MFTTEKLEVEAIIVIVLDLPATCLLYESQTGRQGVGFPYQLSF